MRLPSLLAVLAAVLTPTRATIADTTFQCHAHGSWSDVCSYKNLCFRTGESVPVFINDDPEVHRRAQVANVIVTSTKLLKIPNPPGPNRDVPVHYKRNGAETMTAAWVEDHADKIKWVDEPTWIVSYPYPLKNVWFYSTRILPLFTTYYYKEQFNLPDMANVYIPRPRDQFSFDFHQGLLNMTLPHPDVKVYYQGDNPWEDLKPEKYTVCFKEAVLLGTNMYAFPDQVTAFAFRNKVWKHFDIPVPHEPGFPPPNVTVLDRPSKASRHFGNYNEMLEIMEGYGANPERILIGERYHGLQTFEEQVRKMASTGVFVTMHGAGLLNEIFLPQGAAVIEIFPVHAKHILYEQIASLSGLHHFKVYAREFTSTFHDVHPVYLKENCEAEQSLLMPDTHYCWIEVKCAIVLTPLVEFEIAFAHARDFAGVRTPLLGLTTLLLKDKSLPAKE